MWADRWMLLVLLLGQQACFSHFQGELGGHFLQRLLTCAIGSKPC